MLSSSTLLTPSQTNHAPRNEDSGLPNLAAITFIRETSAMLQLPLQTIGTTLLYYHRYHEFMRRLTSEKPIAPEEEAECLQIEETLLATTCIHVACKTTETPRKIRDVINVGHRFLHPKEPTLDISETYYGLRSSLITSELVLLRALGYELDAELPFGWALKVIRGTALIGAAFNPQERMENDGVVKRGRKKGRGREERIGDGGFCALIQWPRIAKGVADVFGSCHRSGVCLPRDTDHGCGAAYAATGGEWCIYL
ncbi:cyclin-like protein [Endogone sp. FLAS-F59071]|nr:cyclin-like protein [Endogone sp. FLAS-F59071]|eukprot:RUS15159.1 cyclin-like protein [Endogone sp. FLAS-F59071]